MTLTLQLFQCFLSHTPTQQFRGQMPQIALLVSELSPGRWKCLRLRLSQLSQYVLATYLSHNDRQEIKATCRPNHLNINLFKCSFQCTSKTHTYGDISSDMIWCFTSLVKCELCGLYVSIIVEKIYCLRFSPMGPQALHLKTKKH